MRTHYSSKAQKNNPDSQLYRVKKSVDQIFITAVVVITLLGLSAIYSKYPGSIRLQFGAEGIKLEVQSNTK